MVGAPAPDPLIVLRELLWAYFRLRLKDAP